MGEATSERTQSQCGRVRILFRPRPILKELNFFRVSAIRYAVNLHEHHGLPLTNAYTAAVAQFRSLRSEHHIASAVARREADAYGIQLGPSQVEISFQKEDKALDTWHRKAELDAGALAARKRWKAIVDRDPGPWTRGQEYVRLWKEGIRPTYSPALAGVEGANVVFETVAELDEETAEVLGEVVADPKSGRRPPPEDLAQSSDFVGLKSQT